MKVFYEIILGLWTLAVVVYTFAYVGAEVSGALHQIFFAIHWVLGGITVMAWGVFGIVHYLDAIKEQMWLDAIKKQKKE